MLRNTSQKLHRILPVLYLANKKEMKEYEVWQRAGRHGFYGPEYEEKRIGTFLQVMMGFESQGAIGAYKERVYNVFVTDAGDVRTTEVQYSYLKQNNN